ncbi:MAG TPA: hypothetical protein VF523_10010 [Burkholderiales bacterium]|uniref:hypothetical protein n=1 Tax=Sphingobium sp. TaxID=1912891 RepID=UPI002ED682F3
MDLIPLKRLFLVAGFEGQDLEARIHSLQQGFEGGDHKFVVRVYPTNATKRTAYLQKLVQDANKLIFGEGGATNFCRKQDQLCALAHDSAKGNVKHCERKHMAVTACGRTRPQLVIILCASRIFDEAFKRLGRATLIVRFDSDEFPASEAVLETIAAFEPTVQKVITAVNNRSKTLYAPLMPFRNFQEPAEARIAAEVQANPAAFDDIMQSHHQRLYDGGFKNPKRNIRGAYMFDGQTAFQQDHLHKTVQVIGQDSRTDGFHLLNAYHLYGVRTDPSFHFDVMNAEGKAINHVFEDVLTGTKTDARDRHLNITPCDRRV